MKVSKITFLLLLASYYSDGHYIFKNYNNQQLARYPSLDFRTFPQYFKPMFRVKIPQRPIRTGKRIQNTQTPSTTINNEARSNQGQNGMLSFINNVLKPSIMKVGMPSLVKSSAQKRDRRLHGLRLRKSEVIHNNSDMIKNKSELIKNNALAVKNKFEGAKNKSQVIKNKTEAMKNKSEMIKNKVKEVKNKLDEKKNKVNEIKNKSEALKSTATKDKSKGVKNKTNILIKKESANQMDSNDTGIIENPEKLENFINTIEAKSIFGNFIGNKHFSNIFVFYPQNVDTPIVVELKDNTTEVLTERTVDKSIHEQSDHKFINESTDTLEEKTTELIEKEGGLVESKDSEDSIEDTEDLSNQPVDIFRIPDLLATTTDGSLDNENQIPVDKLTDVVEENSRENLASNQGDDNESPKKDGDNITLEEDLESTVTTTADSITERGSVSTTTSHEEFFTSADASESPLANFAEESSDIREENITEDKSNEDSSDTDELIGEKDVDPVKDPLTERFTIDSDATTTKASSADTSDTALVSTTTEISLSNSDSTTVVDNVTDNLLEDHTIASNEIKEESDNKEKADDLDTDEPTKNDDEESADPSEAPTTTILTTVHDVTITKDAVTVETTIDDTTSPASIISTTTEMVTNDSSTASNESTESTSVDDQKETNDLKDDDSEEDKSDDQEKSESENDKTNDNDDESDEITSESDKSPSTEISPNNESTTVGDALSEKTIENKSEESDTTKEEDHDEDNIDDEENDHNRDQIDEKEDDTTEVSTTNAAITTITTEAETTDSVEATTVTATENENLEATTQPITESANETVTTNVESTTAADDEADDTDEYPASGNSSVDDAPEDEYIDIEYAYF